MPAELESARRLAPWFALMATGCVFNDAPAKPLEVPEIQVEVLHYFGDPLSGPTQQGARTGLPTESPSVVHCRAYYLENSAPILQPLASRLDLVIGMLDHRPVLPSTTLAASARVGAPWKSGEAPQTESDPAWNAARVMTALSKARDRALVEPFGRVVRLGSRMALAPLGGNVVFELSTAADSQSGEIETTLIVSQVRPGEFEVSLVVQRGSTASDPSVERQLLSLQDSPPLNGPPMVLLLPSTFEPNSSRAIALVYETSWIDPTSELFETLASECEANLEETAQSLAQEQISAEGFEREAQNEALESFIQEGSSARLDLIYAIEDRPVAIARDLAISGSDQILDEWSKRLQYLSVRPVGDWALTASSLLLLVEFANQGDGAPELDALLVEHAGQLGRRAGQLRALVESTTSMSEWRSTIVMENQDSLRDSDPSARVRAFDWLRARGIEVEGYDPLADETSRRNALRAHRERSDR